MFEKILECPQCRQRFHYEHEGQSFPETILCPECKESSPSKDYSVLVFCTACRSKIAAPLEMLYAPELRCPRCGENLSPDDMEQHDSFGSTIAGGTAAAPKERKSLLQPGEFFDKYRIIELLGKGGMAEVYLAEHLLLKQKCALKLMLQYLDQDDPVFIKRFLREAKLTHSLNHPNIVKVFDAGSDFNSGCLYIAMEYVEGCTLSDLAARGTLTEGELLGVLNAMCMALKSLEEAQIVHRDIKPSNIMLTMDGIYKLMDLGIAKSDARAAGEMTLTMDQTCIGTPGYASPEQCQSAHKVDVRSDIFSLGATIYHAATGVIPFDGDTPVAVILKVLQEEPVPIEEYRSDLSPQFVALIKKMMAKDPKDRPGSVDELQKLVFAVGSGKDIPRGRMQRTVRKWKEKSTVVTSFISQKKFSKLLFWGAVILLSIVGLFHVYYFACRLFSEEFSESYIEFIRQVFADEEEKPVKKKVYNFREMIEKLHPLGSYPDELGRCRNSNRYDPARRKFSYRHPLVCSTADLKKHIVACYTFDSEKEHEALKGKTLQSGCLLLSKDEKRIVFDRIPGFRGDRGGSFTVSVNLQFTCEREEPRLNIGGIDILWRYSTIYLLFPGGYFTSCNITSLTRGEWVNLTISYDAVKRRIVILSGNRLLGAVLAGKQVMDRPSVSFGSEMLDQNFTGRIDSMIFSNSPMDLELKSGASAEIYTSRGPLPDVPWNFFPAATSPKRAEPPKKRAVTPQKSAAAPAVSGEAASTAALSPGDAVARFRETIETGKRIAAGVAADRNTPAPSSVSVPSDGKLRLTGWRPRRFGMEAKSLDEQLQIIRSECRAYGEAVQKWQRTVDEAPADLPEEIRIQQRALVKKSAELHKIWQKRLEWLQKRNSRIEEARRHFWNEAENRRLYEEIRRYTRKRHTDGFGRYDRSVAGRILQYYSRDNVDPNLEIQDMSRPDLNGSIVKAIAAERFDRGEELSRAMIRRYADLTPVNGFKKLPSKELIRYGIPAKQLDSVFLRLFYHEKKSPESLYAALFADGAVPHPSLLFRAVSKGDHGMVLFLLACGVDPNECNSYGETPLFNAWRLTDGKAIRDLLLAAGCDRSLLSRDGIRASDCGILAELTAALEKGDCDKVGKIFASSKVSADSVIYNGDTLLTAACRRADEEMIKLLLAKGADPKKYSRTGTTPLGALCSEQADVEKKSPSIGRIILLLLEKGADLDVPPEKFGFSHSVLWRICRDFPDKNLLIPRVLPYLRKMRGDRWHQLFSVLHEGYNTPRGVAPENTELLLDQFPMDILKKQIWSLMKFRLTPQLLKKLFAAGVDPNMIHYYRYKSPSGVVAASRSLLYELVISRQSPEVIETALRAGARSNWVDHTGVPLIRYAKDPKVQALLKKYSPK